MLKKKYLYLNMIEISCILIVFCDFIVNSEDVYLFKLIVQYSLSIVYLILLMMYKIICIQIKLIKVGFFKYECK